MLVSADPIPHASLPSFPPCGRQTSLDLDIYLSPTLSNQPEARSELKEVPPVPGAYTGRLGPKAAGTASALCARPCA